VNRLFVTTITNKNLDSASLYGTNIAADVSKGKEFFHRITYPFPNGTDNVLVGMEILVNEHSVATPLAIFRDGTILAIDTATGATNIILNVCNHSRILTTAIEIDAKEQIIYAISDDYYGRAQRNLVTIDLKTKKFTEKHLLLPESMSIGSSPFQMAWLDRADAMVVFYMGITDAALFVRPDGNATWAFKDLSKFNGSVGYLDFTEAEDQPSDTWNNACVDQSLDRVYFQCSDVDGSSGTAVAALCAIEVSKDLREASVFVSEEALEEEGYAGMNFAPVISSENSNQLDSLSL